MKIDAPGSVRTNMARRAGKARNGAGGGFAERLSDASEKAPVAGSGGATQLSSVEALVALQEVPDATGDSRPPDQKRAEDLLERLDQIRLGILNGRIARHDLEALANRLTVRRQGEGDPRLLALIDEIELRAKVELAKLSML